MEETLLINARIIIDGQKTILNGALAYKENIINVFNNVDDKLLKDFTGKIVDLKGLTLMPSFVDYKDYKDKMSLYENDHVNFNVIENIFSYNDFNVYKPGVLNLAYSNNYYLIMDIDNVDDEVLKFSFRVLDLRKVIIASKARNVIIRLLGLGLDFNDITKMTSINIYELLNIKNKGGLIKGKPSDFIIINDDGKLIMNLKDGKII